MRIPMGPLRHAGSIILFQMWQKSNKEVSDKRLPSEAWSNHRKVHVDKGGYGKRGLKLNKALNYTTVETLNRASI